MGAPCRTKDGNMTATSNDSVALVLAGDQASMSVCPKQAEYYKIAMQLDTGFSQARTP